MPYTHTHTHTHAHRNMEAQAGCIDFPLLDGVKSEEVFDVHRLKGELKCGQSVADTGPQTTASASPHKPGTQAHCCAVH